ncbi:SMI1/KNR4 family protein [Actinokineospora diospyrosa]|uniref:SMI1/KNR4 family protein n=1 Tax=Actinokineospora diospyrosa TaxID=103728 RepID=A0ABT1IBX6_9PSEU|nr:SMI1/KNR4 family protein [Actinokineospora diospyrosa]MCP2270135.1 hypothetical protein [Actinokineospora diospyrosa]
MDSSLAELVDVASLSLAAERPNHEIAAWLADRGRIGVELAELLGRRNGFYAFESALHVFGLGAAESPDLERWNAGECWRDAYAGSAEGYLFFAEDVFGFQYAVSADGERVVLFDPETAGVERVADSLGAWAAEVLAEADYRTGHPLARAWQERFGALPPGSRLLPKMPFVAGGKYEVDNLYLLDAVEGMRVRGSIAVQIRDLPEGTPIRFEIT